LEKAAVVYQKRGPTFYMARDFQNRFKAALTEKEEVGQPRGFQGRTVISVLVKADGGQLPDFGEWLQKPLVAHHMLQRSLPLAQRVYSVKGDR
jgi:hypothetical protein